MTTIANLPAQFQTSILQGEVTPIAWVLELSYNAVEAGSSRLGKSSYFFSEQGVDVSLDATRVSHAQARMEVESKPSMSFSPYQGRVSVSACRVSILPVPGQPFRIQDLPEITGRDWAQFTAVLYRYMYKKGTLKQYGDVTIAGTMDAFSLTPDGVFSFDLLDFSSVKYNPVLPDVRLWRDSVKGESYTLPSDQEGRSLPILYGYGFQIPVPIVDSSGNGKVGSRTNLSVQQLQVNGTNVSGTTKLAAETIEGTRFLAIRNDDGANPITSDSQVTITAYGERDQGNVFGGTQVSGVGRVITNPASILAHLARKYVGVPWSLIDKASFKDVFLKYLKDYSFGVSFGPDSTVDFGTLLGRFSYLTGCLFFWERGILQAKTLVENTGTEFEFNEQNILSFSDLSWNDNDEIINEITVLYRRGFNSRDRSDPVGFQRSFLLSRHNNANFKKSQKLYGVRRAPDILLPEVFPDKTARLVAARVGQLAHKPRVQVSVTADRTSHNIGMGSKVVLDLPVAPSSDGLGWSGKRFVVIAIQKDLEQNTFRLLEI